MIDTPSVLAFQSDNGRGEHLATLLMLQALGTERPPHVTGNPQTIQVRLDAVIEVCQVFQRIVRRNDCSVAKKP
jgi:hypothetical protein